MEYNKRAELIKALNKEVGNTKNNYIDTTNYISDTASLNTSAMGLSLDTLRKTKQAIDEQEQKFIKISQTEETVQLLAHLRVAKKCVQEIIGLKLKENAQ